MEEREIDLRMLFYKMLTKWRSAVLLGLICGIAACAYALIGDLRVYLDEDAYNEVYKAYEAERDDQEADKLVLESEVESLTISNKRRQEYSTNSVLMKIDPMQVYVGTMTLYVDGAEDSHDRLMAAYTQFMNGGDMYRFILDRTDIVSEEKYLQELLTITVDAESSAIIAEVKGADEESVSEILALVYDAIYERADFIDMTVADHTIGKTSEHILVQVDLNLDEAQRNNETYLANSEKALETKTKELNQSADTVVSAFPYSVSAIVKHAVRMLLIGGIAGVIVAFGWVAVVYVLTRRLMDDTFWACSGISYLGLIWNEPGSHKAFKKIDTLVDRICGIPALSGGLEESSALVGATINGIMKNGRFDKIAVVSTEPAEQMNAVIAAMKEQISGEVIYAGNILADAGAIAALENCDNIVLAAKENVTTTDDIFRQKELLNSWGKKLLGAIGIR